MKETGKLNVGNLCEFKYAYCYHFNPHCFSFSLAEGKQIVLKMGCYEHTVKALLFFVSVALLSESS
jgi:hypothetical protein